MNGLDTNNRPLLYDMRRHKLTNYNISCLLVNTAQGLGWLMYA
jgi:hypothetical protein